MVPLFILHIRGEEEEEEKILSSFNILWPQLLFFLDALLFINSTHDKLAQHIFCCVNARSISIKNENLMLLAGRRGQNTVVFGD